MAVLTTCQGTFTAVSDGISVSSVVVEYYLSASATTQTGGSWSTTVPAWADGKYMWSRTKTTLSSGSTTTTTPVCITGGKGGTGAAGKGVKSIVTQFYLSTSKTTQTGGSWGTTMPAWTTGKYVWTRSLITYTDNTTTTTSPQCDSSWEAVNNLEATVNQKFTKVEASIEAQAGEIELRAKKTEVQSAINYADNAKANYGYQYKCEIVMNGDASKYYPVVIKLGNQNVMREILVVRSYLDTAPLEWNGHTTTKGITLMLKCKCNFGGWGGIAYSWNIHELNEQYGNVFAGATSCMSGMGFAIYLRGGGETGATYRIYSDQAIEFTGANAYHAASPQICYNRDLIGWNGGTAENPTYSWNAPGPRTRTQEIIDEINSKIYIDVANTAKADAETAQTAADTAQAIANSNETRITVSESVIKQLSDSISMLVTDKNGTSMMTQTSTGWTFNMGAIEGNLTAAVNQLNTLSGSVTEANTILAELDSLVDDLSKKTAYIVMATDDGGNPCIELGKENNPFKLRITNTSVDFMEGSSKIAYVSNKTLYIERAIIKDELQIGEGTGFVWKKRANGNMGLRWIGG